MDEGPDLLSCLVDAVASPNLDVALDIGHVHCYSPLSLREWITRLGPKIGYVHLHDNHGLSDDHLALGQGGIPLPGVLEDLLQNAPRSLWSIESGGLGTWQSLHWLQSNRYIS